MFKLALRLAPALIALTPAAAAQEVLVGMPDDWVQPITDAASVGASGQAVTILGYEVQTRFSEEINETYQASRVRVETPEGLQIGNVAVSWTPASSTLTFHEVAIERDGDLVDGLGDGSAFRVVDAEPMIGQAMMKGIKTAIMQVEGLRVGDTLRLAYTVTQNDALIGAPTQVFHARPSVDDGVTARFRYLWDGEATWRVVGELGDVTLEELRPRDLLLTVTGSDEEDEVPPGAPARAHLTPRFEMSAFERWEEVAALFEAAYDEAASIELGSELADEVERIVAATEDPVVRADLALDLVQDQVRYFFSSLGTGGYAPSRAEDVWAKRFGDCKGKTVLLLALLRGVGVEADAALVSTGLGDALPEMLPNVSLFDHVVVRARIGGRDYWLDGTQRGGAVQGTNLTSYRFALPLTRGEDDLAAIEAAPEGRAVRSVSIEVDASDGLAGPLPVTVRQKLRGPFAQAARLAAPLSDAQREQQLSFVLSDLDGKFDWEDVTIEAPPTGPATLTTTGTVELGKRGEAGARRYVVPGGELGWNPKTMAAAEDRELPWSVGPPGTLSVETTMRLPEGEDFYVEGLNADAAAGGLFLSRRTRIEGGRLLMTAAFETAAFEIPATEVADAAGLLAKAYRNEPTVTADPSPNPAASTVQVPDEPFEPDPDATFSELAAAADRYFRAARFDDAVIAYDAALAARPRSARVSADRAMALIWLGRPEEARQGFEETLSIDPESWVALHGLGVLDVRSGEYERGIDHLDTALKINPADDFAREWRAQAHREADRPEEGLVDASYLLNKHPANVGYAALRASLLADAGREEEALAAVDELDEDVSTSTRLAIRAELLEGMNRHAEALAALGEAAEQDSGNADRWNSLCWYKATNDVQVDSALSDCDRALALSPGRAAYLDSRGLVHFRAGRLDQAIEDYDAALSEVPNLAPSLYGRALARGALGDGDGANADAVKARKAAPRIDDQFEAYGLRIEG